MKKYTLNITSSDNKTKPVDITLPSSKGNYEFNLTLSDGQILKAGIIKVGSTVNTYRLTLTLSNGSEIDCGTFSTEAIETIMRFFVGGNWKMNFTEADIQGYVDQLMFNNTNTTIVLFPQACLLKSLHDALTAKGAINGNTVKLGAQLCSPHASGAFTGQNSVAALKSVGAEYFMVGNEEVESYMNGEDGANYEGQIEQVLTNGGTLLFYLNESVELHNSNDFQNYVIQRLGILSNYVSTYADKIILVYVPVWAIGTGASITPVQIEEKFGLICSTVASLFDQDIKYSLTYAYGGTSSPNNILEILAHISASVGQSVYGTIAGAVSLKVANFNNYLSIIGGEG